MHSVNLGASPRLKRSGNGGRLDSLTRHGKRAIRAVFGPFPLPLCVLFFR